MDEAERNRLLKRGVSEIIVESEFAELLDSGKSLRLKMGFDPSAPDITVGLAVGLRKLRQFQDIGHRATISFLDTVWTTTTRDSEACDQETPGWPYTQEPE